MNRFLNLFGSIFVAQDLWCLLGFPAIAVISAHPWRVEIFWDRRKVEQNPTRLRQVELILCESCLKTAKTLTVVDVVAAPLAAAPKGSYETHTLLRGDLRRVFSKELCRRFSEGFWGGVFWWFKKRRCSQKECLRRRGFSEGGLRGRCFRTLSESTTLRHVPHETTTIDTVKPHLGIWRHLASGIFSLKFPGSSAWLALLCHLSQNYYITALYFSEQLIWAP